MLNRTMITAEKNASIPGTVQQPIGRSSTRAYVSAQGSLSRRHCDDCLKWQFQPFELSQNLRIESLQELFAIILAQIHLFCEVLHKINHQQQQSVNQNVIQANIQNNLLEKLNKLDSEQRQQVYAQNRIYINKNVEGDQSSTSGRRRQQGQTGFKIMEKMNTML